jgi:hypothetical protein
MLTGVGLSVKTYLLTMGKALPPKQRHWPRRPLFGSHPVNPGHAIARNSPI